MIQTDINRLQDLLAKKATSEGLLDLAYRTVDSPFGPLLIAGGEQGLVRVAFETEDFDRVLDQLASNVSPRLLKHHRSLDPVARQLEEYFIGSRQAFDIPVDVRLSSGFRQQVQTFLPKIGYGQTMTYKDLAEQVGHEKAVRAVGSACATNPLPIVLPCHRVVRSDGGLGGYLGGLEAKRLLLQLENEHVR